MVSRGLKVEIGFKEISLYEYGRARELVPVNTLN